VSKLRRLVRAAAVRDDPCIPLQPGPAPLDVIDYFQQHFRMIRATLWHAATRVPGRLACGRGFRVLMLTGILLTSTIAPAAGQSAGAPADNDQTAAAPLSSPSQTRGERAFKGAFNASFRLLMMEHAGRIAFQEKTRRELGGPFWSDYVRSVKAPKTWGDGDGWFVNYLGHPIHGAAAGRAWLVHHPDSDVDIGVSRKYWASRARAARWAAWYSLQFEFGPLSEASIGNVGLRPNTTGWVDHVVTPAGAFGIIVAEDALDRYLVQFVERHTGNRVLRATARIILNPSRALANVADWRAPWFRTRGTLKMVY
jgi:hypothetical protein